jgi:hypothetical protein
MDDLLLGGRIDQLECAGQEFLGLAGISGTDSFSQLSNRAPHPRSP